MSKIALNSNASGTGVFTIASPNSDTDYTINLPEISGGEFVATNASGNVGVGTTNPGRRLNVLGVYPIVAVIESSTTGAGIGFKDATTTGDNQITVRAIGQNLNFRGADG